MTDERDPLPDEPHRPVSSDWARKNALQATKEAVQRAKDARKRPIEETK